MQRELHFIEKCRHLVEEKVNLGSSADWKNREFEILSDQILKETGVHLSVATLKRIWGKIRYESRPNITTLNTLAQFTGHGSWGSFLANGTDAAAGSHGSQPSQSNVGDVPEKSQLEHVDRPRGRRAIVLTSMAAAIVFAIVFFQRAGSPAKPTSLDPTRFSFSSKKAVTSGIPNSVIFDYDASAASPTDTILIQQSWDTRLQQAVPYDQHRVTSIYYHPGFFKAKLVVNGRVMREHDLTINTDGWLVLAERNNDIPVYFARQDFIAKGALSLPVSSIKESNIGMQPDPPNIAFYNVRNFGGLRTDDFYFEARVKNDFREGSAACQQTQIMLICEENFISIPLSAKGCISTLSFYFLGSSMSGKKEDLSSFGQDFDDWVKVTATVRNGVGQVHVNNQLAFESPVKNPVSSITGIVFRFAGTGSVDQVILRKTDGTSEYREDF